MNARALIILAVIVVAIVGAAMWFLSSQPKPALPPAITAPTTPVGVERSTPFPPQERPKPRNIASATPVPEMEEPADQLEEWERQINEILRVDTGERETAQMLINLLPTLPAEGQAEAAQHISNLILDEDYNLVLPLIRNPALPEEVHDVLLTDLMNREDPVKLPTLLEIARQPTHPLQEEALIDLEVFLDEEFGTDWARWEDAVTKYVAEQQAEEGVIAEPMITQ